MYMFIIYCDNINIYNLYIYILIYIYINVYVYLFRRPLAFIQYTVTRVRDVSPQYVKQVRQCTSCQPPPPPLLPVRV